MSGSKISRRKALKFAAAGAAGALAVPYFVPSSVLAADGHPGANDRVRIGFIGTGHRANQLMDQVPPPGQIVSVSDCYLKHAEDTVAAKKTNWTVYQDFRKMLDKEQLDGVVIATPDHVRAGLAIQVCQAGKDVYAEKPLTAYIGEGRALVNAARKYKTVFQVGSQQRTMEVNRFACDFVRNGGLGKLKFVQGVNYTGPGGNPEFSRRADSRGGRLERLVRPDQAAAVHAAHSIRLGTMARLFRRRNDQLGRAMASTKCNGRWG